MLRTLILRPPAQTLSRSRGETGKSQGGRPGYEVSAACSSWVGELVARCFVPSYLVYLAAVEKRGKVRVGGLGTRLGTACSSWVGELVSSLDAVYLVVGAVPTGGDTLVVPPG